ncbi:VOC family protein [Glycomyces sp. TRM65418]|uniref:VOC family protein n=1 Tax=Glycomyces sp. TRM65418 TaxID=2867006 RepID=UPI001CE61864|nr:VOC family protein [Glycomyces sp. TRM65418]MCC3764240.1 VOC family protein [Glycomyces sp. TRM65418]QZD53923.1 VOC family protein [Glycomyces sp. TRM65418]
MTATIGQVTFDCQDPYALSLFWTEVTGYTEDPDDPNAPEHTENFIGPDGGHPGLLFIRVPEPKTVKNRLHLDLVPETTRDEEVERLIGLGATLVDDHRRPDGSGWVVLADPEGNEFCVERSKAERAGA